MLNSEICVVGATSNWNRSSRLAAHSFTIGTGPFKKRNSNLKEK